MWREKPYAWKKKISILQPFTETTAHTSDITLFLPSNLEPESNVSLVNTVTHDKTAGCGCAKKG